MPTSSTLPRPADPDWRPSEADTIHSAAVHALEMAIRGAVAHLDGPERSVVIADALEGLELDALSWCGTCQAIRPEGICYG